jgi:hypothetical protein
VENKKGRIRRVKYLQITLAILAALSASLAVAEDFRTVNGKEYKDATVTRVEPDGIVLRTKSGITKVYFAELPKEVQERFYPKQQETPSASPTVVSSATPPPHVDLAAGPTKWDYSEYQDEMGRGTTKFAQVDSLNTVRFGFPYGETHAILELRNSPKYGRDIILRVERGQFVSSYTKDFVTVKFDEGALQKFTIREPRDGTSNVRFIHDNEDDQFMSQLRKGKRLKIEADFYDQGSRVFEFDVHGLNW